MADVLIYARVSKPEQNIDQQKEQLWEYATERLGFPVSSIDILGDERTGTNTDRSGYQEMLRRVRNGDVDKIVVRNIRRLGRTMREINENVREMIDDHGSGLYTLNDPFEIEPGGELSSHEELLLSVLAWAAQVEAENISENTIAGLRAAKAAGKWVGRPPYGFTTGKEGHLQPDGNFGRAVEAIRAVEDLGWSHREVAKHTGVPRRTVPNILDRRDLYLDE